MKFKLIYYGELLINPKRRTHHLHDIRSVLSPQLKRLTEISPYTEIRDKLTARGTGVREVGGVKFFPIITPELDLLAEIDVQIMHPEILDTPHADIDNRMKTLLDALKRPQNANEVAEATQKEVHGKKDNTIYTLLDDDHLVTRLTINTSHLLAEPSGGLLRTKKKSDALDHRLLLIISVNIRASRGTIDNLCVII